MAGALLPCFVRLERIPAGVRSFISCLTSTYCKPILLDIGLLTDTFGGSWGLGHSPIRRKKWVLLVILLDKLVVVLV